MTLTCTNVTLRQKPLRNDRISLYLDYYPAIRNPYTMKMSRREFLGIYIYAKPKNEQQRMFNQDMLNKAEAIRCIRVQSLINEEFGVLDKNKQKVDFLAYFRTKAREKYEKWDCVYNHFEKFVGGKCTFGDVTVELCEKFRDYLLKCKQINHPNAYISRNSAAGYYSTFRALLKIAYKEKMLRENLNDFLEKIEWKEVKKEYLTLDEVKKLAATPCKIPVLKQASLFACMTGLRISDILKLDWRDFEVGPDQGYYIRICTEKTETEATLPISQEALELCGEWGTGKVFKGLGGLVLNLLTVMIVLLGIVVTVALWFLLKDWVSLPQMLGVHYGAVTNTPGLGATQEALDLLHYEGENIAVAYACAYPLGVVGAIFSAVLLRKIFSIDLAEEDKHWETEEKEHNREPIFFHVEVTNPAVAGKTLGAIREFTGRSFICSRILSKGELSSPTAETVVQEGDVLRIVAAPEDRLPVTAFFGGEKQGVDLATEKSPLATRTILITREKFNGMTLKALALNQMDGVNITRVFRAGMTLFPYSNLHLQVGDQVYCVGPEPALQRLETLLGNKMKKLYHPNIFTIFVGLAFGIVLGSIPIAVPGMPAPLKLGLAGGPLIVAILLGRFGNFARLVTYTTQSASLMMREIGISLFQIGRAHV